MDALFGVEQRAEYHPEIDAGVHTLMVCDMAARLAPGNERVGFAALVHDLLARCDGFRQPARIAELAQVCEADKRGRAGLQDAPYPQAAELLRLLAAAQAVRAADVAREGLEGPALGEALRQARTRAIGAARQPPEPALPP